MRKREGMKKRRSRILAWLLACFMVLSVIQGTGWGSLTVQAEEEVNIPTTLSVGNNDIITEGKVSETTEGDGWSYNADTNTLILTKASLGSITYDGGDLNLQISGENTVGQIDAENFDAAYITGIENGTDKAKLYCGGSMVLCQDLVQVKMRNFSHFNPPEAQPQCVFFHTIVRIHLVTYSCNGYEFVSYCRKLPDIQKSTGMPAYNRGF